MAEVCNQLGIQKTQTMPFHTHQTLSTRFEQLETASLTLNLAKCEFAQATVTYLGKQVGGGQVRALDAKVAAIVNFPAPGTR